MRILIPLRCSKLREIEGWSKERVYIRCSNCSLCCFQKNYLNNVLKAEKFKFDVVQDAQEDIEANANPTGAVQRARKQFKAIYKKYKECHKRKKKDSTLTCPKWAGRKVEDEMKEIVYFGTYEDPKDANREKIDKITIRLKRSFKTTGSFQKCARHLEDPSRGVPCFKVVNPRYEVVFNSVGSESAKKKIKLAAPKLKIAAVKKKFISAKKGGKYKKSRKSSKK